MWPFKKNPEPPPHTITRTILHQGKRCRVVRIRGLKAIDEVVWERPIRDAMNKNGWKTFGGPYWREEAMHAWAKDVSEEINEDS